MNKKIIAVIIALVIVLLSFASCKKGESESLYYLDEEGNTQYVQVDDEGKYYTTDDNGNKTYIEDESVIEKIENNSEAISIENELEGIVSNPDKVFENADDEENFQMSDELVEQPLVTVAPNTGKAEAQKRLNNYMNIVSKNIFTIKASIKELGNDPMEYPFTYIRNGNGAYIETAVPFEAGKVIKANMIIVNGVTYCEIPSIKSYMVVDDMSIEDLADGTFDNKEMENYVFVESGVVTLSGKKFNCDVYSVDGETVKYYYNADGGLARIEKIGKKSSVITEIKSIKATADTSKIKKPRGIDITALIGEI